MLVLVSVLVLLNVSGSVSGSFNSGSIASGRGVVVRQGWG